MLYLGVCGLFVLVSLAYPISFVLKRRMDLQQRPRGYVYTS